MAGMSVLTPCLATTLSTACWSPPASGVTVGEDSDGMMSSTAWSWAFGDVELQQDVAAGADRALEQQRDVLHRGALARVLVRLAAGDQLGVAGEQRVEDAQAVLAQRRAGLGEVDDHVDDVGDLRLGGAVGGHHPRLDAVLGEEALGQRGELGGDPHALGQVGDGLPGRVVRHGHDDAHRVGRGLGVLQLTERDDVGVGLGDPVAAGDAEVEQALFEVGGDLLRAQDAYAVDARVVDRGPVVAVGAAPDGQVGGVEQLERRAFEGPLGQYE